MPRILVPRPAERLERDLLERSARRRRGGRGGRSIAGLERVRRQRDALAVGRPARQVSAPLRIAVEHPLAAALEVDRDELGRRRPEPRRRRAGRRRFARRAPSRPASRCARPAALRGSRARCDRYRTLVVGHCQVEHARAVGRKDRQRGSPPHQNALRAAGEVLDPDPLFAVAGGVEGERAAVGRDRGIERDAGGDERPDRRRRGGGCCLGMPAASGESAASARPARAPPNQGSERRHGCCRDRRRFRCGSSLLADPPARISSIAIRASAMSCRRFLGVALEAAAQELAHRHRCSPRAGPE